MRDTQKLGLKYSDFDYNLIIKNAKIINGSITFPISWALDIMRYYNSKLCLSRQIYHNDKILGI